MKWDEYKDHIKKALDILEFDDDIYGQQIRINFVRRIRDEIKFSGIEELIEQIKADVETARDILAK